MQATSGFIALGSPCLFRLIHVTDFPRISSCRETPAREEQRWLTLTAEACVANLW